MVHGVPKEARFWWLNEKYLFQVLFKYSMWIRWLNKLIMKIIFHNFNLSSFIFAFTFLFKIYLFDYLFSCFLWMWITIDCSWSSNFSFISFKGEMLPNPSDYKSSLIALTAHNWLLRISATTGKVLEKIYLASYCKFRY